MRSNTDAESRPITGSPALLMIQGRQLAQRSPFSKEFLTAWALRGADFIKSAGEPVFGTVSSELFGSLHPPSGFGYCPASRSLFGRRPSAASLKA